MTTPNLQILLILLDGDRTVSELVSILGVPQSRVSNHLACVKWCGFVVSQRKGRKVVYHISDQRLGELIRLGSDLARENADHLVSCRRIRPEWI
ncbi:MAG: transcriptional regulator [Acidimicrobiia bacterium]